MKRQFIILILLLSGLMMNAQKETFDLITYSKPAGWKKTGTENARQFSKTDNAKGTYCLITLFKSVEGSGDAKADFNAAWDSTVKATVNVTSAPEMQDSSVENGWVAQTGYAPYESDGTNGVAMLITMSSTDQMVAMLVMTNSNVYEKNVAAFLESVTLKEPNPVKKNDPTIQPAEPPSPPTVVANRGSFTYKETNFDDGWTAREKADWVEVKKGDMTVLIHYPRAEENIYYSVLEEKCSTFWNLLVAPHYNSLRDYKFYYNSSFEPAKLCYAYVTEPGTNKELFVALFSKKSSWMEFIAPDKATFIKYFGIDFDKIDNFFGNWEPMMNMNYYNRFAVGPNDLTGLWTSNFTGMTQYVNAFNGAYAGMDTHSSSESFEFTGGSYKWTISVASGMVGSIRFQNTKSSGKWTIKGNWQVHFSDIEKSPKLYNAYFSCIKGARLLWLQDTGYGGYSAFGKKE